MTTFKNNAKYAELLLTYLDVAFRDDTPLTVEEVLRVFKWRFKGGSLSEASGATRLRPETSADLYPDGTTEEILAQWPYGRQAQALRQLLSNRMKMGRLRNRGVLARIATYQVLTATSGVLLNELSIFTGMRAIYLMFGRIWDWAAKAKVSHKWEQLEGFTQELLVGSSSVSRTHVPTADTARAAYWTVLSQSRVPAMLSALNDLKTIIRVAGSSQARTLARQMGQIEREKWEDNIGPGLIETQRVSNVGEDCLYIGRPLGPVMARVTQECFLVGTGEARLAFSKSDMERLHQLLMSTISALVGVCAQAVVGTQAQKHKASLAVTVTEMNIQRIVLSSRKVPLGDEVLVCKGYRRAYTAHLGWLAGPLCTRETTELIREAEETAAPGVLDVQGFLSDARTLDAASSLNAAKVFKICPAPDVSPGTAMMDRIKQIGDSNVVDTELMKAFEVELKTQILRAYIRAADRRLPLRSTNNRPLWHMDYLQGKFDSVPSAEIDEFLVWEGSAKMPDISPYDPAHWKDSGLGADTITESKKMLSLGHKTNMLTRLIFDDECPMPGREVLSQEHVIKFFTKAEGHKDPARGIFSANLTDRQAQSWMERAVETVARHHPSFMIGQESDVRAAKVIQLTSLPERVDWVPLFYSFDISGWSAKMPAEPQRLSHKIWADLYGGHLFLRSHELNEGAHIYLNMDGYMGWFKNTHANLEGFNGKEMTMVLIGMLSLSVRRWRVKVVEAGVMEKPDAEATAALLFAYIDDGLSRIDLPRNVALAAFDIYKNTVIETFRGCGFSVEVSKCFPSDRFAIFLNEVYLAGRHVVHGVRAAMAIGSEPTERHSTLVERVSSVSTGCRGAVMAGLNPLSATLLMAYHVHLHMLEWTTEVDPVILAAWALCPRTWGGLGLPNMLQMFVSGSGAAFEEGVSTLQAYAKMNPAVRKAYLKLSRGSLANRTAVGVLTAPLSGRVQTGYMVDSRVTVAVRRALQLARAEGRLSIYATRLLKYADTDSFAEFACAVIPIGSLEVLQEQMINNVADSHPHSIFSAFARRLEKSMTVMSIVGREVFFDMVTQNRDEAEASARAFRTLALY